MLMRSSVLGCVLGGLLLSSLLGMACAREEPAEVVLTEPVEAVIPIEEAEEETAVPLRSRSQRAALRTVELVLHGWAEHENQLQFQVSLENPPGGSLALVGTLSGADFRMIDVVGQELAPDTMSLELEELAPASGLAPGVRRYGWLSFSRPVEGPLKLRLPSFEPLSFRLSELPRLPAVELGVHRLPPVELPPGSGSEEPSEERAELELLLQQQSEALVTYNIDAYLRTFLTETHERERMIFQRLRLVPITSARFEMLAEPRRVEEDRLRVATELRLHIEGLAPDNPMVYTPVIEAWLTEGGWRVHDLAIGIGQRMFWREGDLTLHRSNHFRIYAHPSQQQALAEVAAEAESAYAELQRQQLPLDAVYLIHLLPDRASFARVAGTDRALGVALARYELVGAKMGVDSRAFFINGGLLGDHWRRLTREVRHMTITHELVHLALARQTRPYTPPWLKEGVAVYFSNAVEFDATRRLFRKGLDHLDLQMMTVSRALGEHDAFGEQTADEYLYAGNVVDYLVKTHGKEEFLAFYGSFADLNVGQLLASALEDGGPGFNLASASRELASKLTSDALSQHFEMDVATLENEVEEWLRVRHR